MLSRSIGHKKAHPKLGFRELAYAMIDEDIAYLSPSTVYNILKKHDLIAERKFKHRDPVRIGWATKLDQKRQSDIMYIRIHGRFFYLRILKDEYSRYIVHHSLLVSMDAGSVSMEAQVAIEILRKDSLASSVPRQITDLLSYLLNSI